MVLAETVPSLLAASMATPFLKRGEIKEAQVPEIRGGQSVIAHLLGKWPTIWTHPRVTLIPPKYHDNSINRHLHYHQKITITEMATSCSR